MTLGVIEQEGKVKLREDNSQAINTILELNGHVIIRPISLVVCSEFKIDYER